MIIIISVNVVVYKVCKCARRFNPSPIHIKGVGFAKIWGFSVNLMFVECKFVLPKSRVFFHKIIIYRVYVDFVKTQGFFVKLTFTKSRGTFGKFMYMDCGLFEWFFCKIYIHMCS